MKKRFFKQRKGLSNYRVVSLAHSLFDADDRQTI